MLRPTETRRTMILLATVAVATLIASSIALAAPRDLDRAPGGDGRVNTKIGEEAMVGDLIAQPDGKLVAAGFYSPPGNARDDDDVDFALARYYRSGVLDGTFCTGGKKTTGFPGTLDSASALVRQRDGKLVAAGYSYDDRIGRSGEYTFALARYLP